MRSIFVLVTSFVLTLAVIPAVSAASNNANYLVDYSVGTIPLLLLPAASYGFGVGASIPSLPQLWAVADIEQNRWSVSDPKDRLAKDDVSFAKKYDMSLFSVGARYYVMNPAKGAYVTAGATWLRVGATIAQTNSESATVLNTRGSGPFIGGGYSFLENSRFDITLGGRLNFLSLSGDSKSSWPKFDSQPEAHLVNDLLTSPVVKGDITIGYRF